MYEPKNHQLQVLAPHLAKVLSQEFDRLFSQVTGYDDLIRSKFHCKSLYSIDY